MTNAPLILLLRSLHLSNDLLDFFPKQGTESMFNPQKYILDSSYCRNPCTRQKSITMGMP